MVRQSREQDGLTVDERLAIAETALNHRFRDRSLLRSALTHPSFNEDHKGEVDDYERLEFLGDAVIALVVAEELFARFPHEREGGLTKLKVAAVHGATLAGAARDLGLQDAIFLGESVLASGGRGVTSALENVFEALVAALYLDAGFDTARSFIRRTLGAHIGEHARAPRHPRVELQELLQSRGMMPTFHLLAEEGPPHDRSFTVAVELDGEIMGRGSGRTKRQAEKSAAEEALRRLAPREHDPSPRRVGNSRKAGPEGPAQDLETGPRNGT